MAEFDNTVNLTFDDLIAANHGIRALIRFLGDDPDREGLQGTPARVMRAWKHDWGSGYQGDAEALQAAVKLFEPDAAGSFHHRGEDISAKYNEMVIVKDIAFFSHCEHHLAPFFGSIHIAYVPTPRGIIGLSKLARITEIFSRRLQVQERLTVQIADFLATHLSPHIGVQIEATHFCMVSRGVRQPNAKTLTSALRGNLYCKPDARSEFLDACRK